MSIAVPSRTGLLNESTKPLAGVRIAVKDIFDVKGIRRTACNRAYYAISTPAASTAPSIQILIDAGATIVGTTKLSSMISREEPTEATDYQAPFKPRGGGYQSPAGSSSGSASAVASYKWLDIAIGTDCESSEEIYR
jgi:Asp-tRNA(Asn)/Glu-tRNA(Gln) amidotransferase A subunit family amidase